MTLAVIRRWFNRLPDIEKDLPIVIVNGIAYTPRMILHEVMRGSPLGQRLQMMVEAGRLGTTAYQELQLAKIRLREWLAKMPEEPLFAVLMIPPRKYTPSQLLREIEAQTDIGMQWIQAELQHAKRLLALARR